MVLLLHGSGVDQELSSLHPGVHLGQLELGVLELGDTLTELDTLLGVLDGLLHGALAQTQSLRGDTDTTAVQRLHGDLEALALLAQHTILGDDAVLEDQVAGGAAADTHLLLVLTLSEAGVGLFHHEGGNLLHGTATLIGGLTGDGDDDEGISHVAVGDEALGAVEDVVLAGLVQYSGGLLALSVGTGAGLGQAERTDLLAGQQVRQILLLLSLGAVLENGSAAQRGMSGNDNGSGAADLGQLLHAHGIGEDVAAGAAILLGEVNAHHAQLRHLLDGLHGETLFLVDLGGQGLHFVLCKFAVHLANEQLFLSQMEVHTLFSFTKFYLVYLKKPSPDLMPNLPARTIFRINTFARYLLSWVSLNSTSMIFSTTSQPMRSPRCRGPMG